MDRKVYISTTPKNEEGVYFLDFEVRENDEVIAWGVGELTDEDVKYINCTGTFNSDEVLRRKLEVRVETLLFAHPEIGANFSGVYNI